MKNLVFHVQGIAVIILFSLFSLTSFANDPSNDKSIFDLMNHEEILDLTLETDLTALKTNRQDESSYKATISFKDAWGQSQKWDLKVKQRGAFRRVKCSDVPPLRFNFRKSDLEAAGLAPFDDLKLVPQCINDQKEAREILLKEYLAYKLFNEVSDFSYRVQLLRITYKDTATGEKDKQWAFLIEDAAQLRYRVDAEKMDGSYNLPPDSFHLSQARLVAVFEYMIGNVDWGFKTIKNVKYFRKKGKIIPVPYDFDFSAVVAAPYAIPNKNVGQTSLDQRIYLGFAEESGDLHGTIYHLVGKRKAFEDLVMGFKPLSYESRFEMMAYLNSFFDNPEDIRKEAVVGQGVTEVGADR